MSQLTILDIRAPHCPFTHRLEDHDNHCNGLGIESPGYDVITEDDPLIDEWLAVVRGIGFGNVSAHAIELPAFSDVGYIPTIRRGDGELLKSYKPAFVGIRLEDVVSPRKLKVPESLDRFGLPPGTKPILQCYGSDLLIENLWPVRRKIFQQLSKLGFIAATSVNYSIWDNQPHAERLINIKRGLITFEDWQAVGVPAIPHIYWYGYKDLDAWIEWLQQNPDVLTVAINMQTMRSATEWEQAIEHLAYFVAKLDRPIHFMINGPAKLTRIHQLKDLLPSFTLSNAYAARMASAGQLLHSNEDDTWADYSPKPRSDIFGANNSLYERYLASERAKRQARIKQLSRATGAV